MKLQHLLTGVSYESFQGNLEQEIHGVTFDSRQAGPGKVFVAVKGTQVDGHAFIPAAVAAGCTVVVGETRGSDLPEGITWVQVTHSGKALAELSASFYGHPADELVVVGVTGTNGKTSVATLLYELFTRLDQKCGLISTIKSKIGEEEIPATHTTPDPVQLHQLFARMRDAGCVFCFMEVSSHSLDQERVHGIPFRVALFTNLTRDHLDYHGSMDNYLKAKKKLFDRLGSEAVAIINLDDRNGPVMVQNTVAEVKTISLSRMSDYKGKVIDNSIDGLQMEIDGHQAWFLLRGRFNAYNLMLVYATALELGESPEEVLAAMSLIKGIEGRFEVIRDEFTRLTGVVDYAHTPDGLEKVLQTIAESNLQKVQVITVVGCGGNRDKGKRPEMAKIAAKLSDQVILTSDNPRDEAPEEIIRDMEAGLDFQMKRKSLSITDRREAIRTAIRLASPGDIVLVAGKGHETYQEIKGVKYPFDDREELRKAFQEITPNTH
jgi:UDP-N-acetylmuramoyl-L-alanyl-D-glutamate--2,6-diaminopimelate ligase